MQEKKKKKKTESIIEKIIFEAIQENMQIVIDQSLKEIFKGLK